MQPMRSVTGAALAAGSAAVVTGIALLVILGAPQRMPAMQVAALLLGLLASAALAWLGRTPAAVHDALIVGAAALIPSTVLLGPDENGVARWLAVGGVTLQPSLICVPLVALGFVRRPNPPRLAAIALAALGCAAQPDLGAASMLSLAVGGAAVILRTPASLVAALLALAGLGAAALRPVHLPPVPFVEHVIPQAFEAGLLPAILALTAILMLFMPVALLRESAPPALLVAFFGAWSGALLAALLGPYPTPVLGFGASAVLGYLLSLGLLVTRTRCSQAS